MAKKQVQYCVVDAFTESAFKGNPAAVCFLEEERDEEWMQAVASEFNLSETCYLSPILDPNSKSDHNDSIEGAAIPRFRLRWFTPVAEVKICGHATLAASHFLFSSGLVNSNVIEFATLSGILTAKRLPETKNSVSVQYQHGEVQDPFFIELDFPAVPIAEYDSSVPSTISKSLNGASIVEIKKTVMNDDLFIVLPSGKMVVECHPQFDDIEKCPGRGMIITGPAPSGSEFDFFSRFFCPKLGVKEDPVCGSAHCSLAAYWSKKLGKCDFIAYAASPRGGVVHVSIDEKNQRVSLRGKATVVMKGYLLV